MLIGGSTMAFAIALLMSIACGIQANGRAFGADNSTDYEDYEEFLKSGCFSETRDKIKFS